MVSIQKDKSENYGPRIFYACVVLVLAITLNYYFFYTNISTKNDSPLCFMGEWKDLTSGAVKSLRVTFYSIDNTIELFDVNARKLFLRRTQVPSDIQTKDFYVGNTVAIHARNIQLLSYADSQTEQYINYKRQRTLALVKPEAVDSIGEVVLRARDRGLDVGQMRKVHLTPAQAQHLYSEHQEATFFPSLLSYMTSGPVVALELVGEDAVAMWRDMLGPTDPLVARSEAPQSLRAALGTNKQSNAAHGSDGAEAALRELSFFFPEKKQRSSHWIPSWYKGGSATSASCVILPHAVQEGAVGDILKAISSEGFRIGGLWMLHLSRDDASEFLRIYEGVLLHYPRMVHQLSSGAAVTIQILQRPGGEQEEELQSDTHAQFREFVGPMDPEVARELRPGSLRARFGVDLARNGVHCTDLPEDAVSETEYIFKFLQ